MNSNRECRLRMGVSAAAFGTSVFDLKWGARVDRMTPSNDDRECLRFRRASACSASAWSNEGLEACPSTVCVQETGFRISATTLDACDSNASHSEVCSC